MSEKTNGAITNFLIKHGIVENLENEEEVNSEKEIKIRKLKKIVEEQAFSIKLDDGTDEQVILLRNIIDLIENDKL